MKIFFTFFGLIFFSLVSQAQVFVKSDATGIQDGTSWQNAFTNLQDALNAAVPGEQVWIASGIYIPSGPTPDSSHFITTKAVELYGGFVGTESNLTERDLEANLTILSGDKNGDDVPGNFLNYRIDNAHHVLIINAPNTESVIDGLVFESGTTRLDAYSPNASDIPVDRWSGGALYLYKSGAIIRNSLFHNNDGIRGSGVFAFGDTLHTISLQFDNVRLRNNDGYNGAGGFFQAFQDLQFTNTQVTGNSGFQGSGLFFSGSNATVKNCVLDSNAATYGGAILSFHNNLYIRHPELKVLNSSFTGNTASAWGGGLHFYNTYGGFSVVVDSSSFTGNTSPNGYGGGIEIWDAQDVLPIDPVSTITITNSDFIANTSVFGGGVEIETEDDSIKIVIENVKFEANTGVRGGGLTVYAYAESKLDFYMRNTEFAGNVAAIGGGMSMEAINNTYPLNYLLEDVSFNSNMGQTGIGALNIQHYPRADGVNGTIRRALFEDNHGGGVSGAFTAGNGYHRIEDSYFVSNSTDATLDSLYHGGGAINIIGTTEIYLDRNIFEGNISLTDGAAITLNADVIGSIENSLFHQQEGNSTIYNHGYLTMVNSTIVENGSGLFLTDSSSIEIQNSIFSNANSNLQSEGTPEVISKGGNISSDATMTAVLTGSGSFDDLHNTDPLLGLDFVPLAGSPAIDAGNPANVTFPTDLAGNPRVHGGAIDAGSYESFTVATQDVLWDDPDFNVFPNPARTNVNWTITEPVQGNLSATIYNLSGQPVLHTTVIDVDGKQSYSIPVNRLPAGEYYLLVNSGSDKYAATIIILSQ